MTDVVDSSSVLKRYPKTARLAAEILSGNLYEIRPTVDLTSELGFTYSHVENLLQVTAQGALSMLELMTNGDILEKHFHDKFLLCSNCHSPNLRPVLCCPKCGSGNIVKGRVLEHFACGAVTVENECMVSGKYICPKCKKEFRFLGTDYGSLGIKYKCYDCGDVSEEATLKWQCPKCSISLTSTEAREIVMYSYRLKEEKRAELAFDLGPRARLIDFLSTQGYQVTERIIVNGTSKSGAGHLLDILARRDDGIVVQTIAIGILIDSKGKDIGLDSVFNFDDKAYDLGIQDRVLLVEPRLSPEAQQFARRQQITVYDRTELESLLSTPPSSVYQRSERKASQFDNKSKIFAHLRGLGYEVEEKVKIRGRSGAQHTVDILASYDNGLIVHRICMDVVGGRDEVGFAAVAAFDAKAYDLGIHRKVLLVPSGLTEEAKNFALYQKIVVVVVDRAKSPSNAKLSLVGVKHD